MKIALQILFITLIFLFITCFTVTMIFGYETIMLFLLGDSPNSDKIFNLVSAKKFLILQVLCLIAAIGSMLLLRMLEQILAVFNSAILVLKKNVSILINEFRFTEVKWLLIIPVTSSIFFAIVMPVSYDEAYTYLQFTSKSILVSLSLYPVPNNHVLHSMITNITRYIPFLPVLFCLRISSILVSFFTWLLCYSFIKKYYSKHIALIITGIASMLFMSIYYSYMSRGYALVAFFFVLSFYAAFNIIFNNDSRKYWLIFSVSNVLGFFTMPSYLYVFIMMNAWVLWNNKLRLKNQFLYNTLTIVFVGILYVPIIIVNGIGALTSNRFVLPISRAAVRDQLFDFFKTTITEIVGVDYIFIYLLLIVSFILLLKFKMKSEVKAFVVFVVFPFLLLLAHSIIPFPRTFNYYAIVLIFLTFIPYWKIMQNVFIVYIIGAVMMVQLLLFLNFYFNIKKYESFTISYHAVNNKISGNGSYFLSSDFFETYFLFENKIRGCKPYKYYNFSGGSVDVDTLWGFDYYILDKKYDFTKNKKPIYSDQLTNVYSK